ncbi:hypothetical protein ACQPZJ_05300 [Actinoplanes sp. CA-054009]
MFTVKYGNSYATGNISWQNRSVRVSGKIAITVDNCRAIDAETYYLDSKGEHRINGASQGVYCNLGGTKTKISQFDFVAPANISGGAEMVKITLSSHIAPLTSKKCFKATPC